MNTHDDASRACRFGRLRAALGLAVLAIALARPAAAATTGESLHYQWSLRGLLGRIAGLFLPGHGSGELRRRPNDGGQITELEITSPDANRGEYYLYGSSTRPDGTTNEVWSSYRYNGKTNSNRDHVDEQEVVDVASGIGVIRARQPAAPLRLRIWSDGKVFPVVVERVESTVLSVPAGTFTTDHYRVRGVQSEGGEHYWKGGLELWLAHDGQATPVRIVVQRGLANVRLDLLPPQRAAAAAHPERR